MTHFISIIIARPLYRAQYLLRS